MGVDDIFWGIGGVGGENYVGCLVYWYCDGMVVFEYVSVN